MTASLDREHPQVVATDGGPVCVRCMMLLNRDVRDKEPARIRYACPSCQSMFEFSTVYRTWIVHPKT